jgi:hypothetical protein
LKFRTHDTQQFSLFQNHLIASLQTSSTKKK